MKGSLLLLLALALGGCATVTRLDDVRAVRVPRGCTPVEAVEISNTCWLFLSCLPFASGDPDNPNGCTCRLFANTETVANQMKMLEAEAARVGAARAVNVVTQTTDEPWYLIVFLREKIHTSAVLVK